MPEGGEKSEKASPQRVKKAREQGQFLVAREFLTALQFVVALVMIGSVMAGWRDAFSRSLPQLLDRAMSGEIPDSEWPVLIRVMFERNLPALLEFGGALLAVTLATHLGMTRFGFSFQRFTPSFARLNPMAKLKDLPAQNLKSTIEAVVLLAALGAVIRSLIDEHGADLLRLPLESIPSAVAQIGESLSSLLWKAAALFVAFGVVDLFIQQRKYSSRLRMSKQEIKEENKRSDGDPQIKARIRRLRRDLLRRQMMKDVAKATAVVVNPTHYAVAIRYEIESMPSPIVVAKGKNWIALRIRQIAVENQIPVIENPPLARALYSAVEVGRAISPEFYKAIAEILAYVYRLMGRRMPAA
jgi:flagellar biosynthetic protein FlhB